jgi:16S rRNA A1518/A1519 N6-dimethyltransferase RsmA/KsgA/DIM1 with predicted DNA glycosylase/AP lyase activity
VSFEIHRRFAADHVRPGMSVLEVGAGPGRFTRAHLLFACR